MASPERHNGSLPRGYLFGGALAVLGLVSLVTAFALFATGGVNRLTGGSLATLSLLRGTATVQRAGQNASSAGVDGQTLQVGDRIQVAPESNALLTFFEGSTVELEPGTEITVEAIERQAGRSATILLRQAVGTTWARVVALTDMTSRFEIVTPSASAAVRGTLFETAVVLDPAIGSLSTRVRTVEGAVAVSATGREVLVQGGQETTVVAGQTPADPIPIPPAANALTVTYAGPGRMLALDPLGRAVGLGPAGLMVNQVPGATTTAAATSPQVVNLPDAVGGSYSLALATDTAGSYLLTVRGHSPGQPDRDLQTEGEVRPGQEVTIDLRVNLDEGRLGDMAFSAELGAPARRAKIVVPSAMATAAARAGGSATTGRRVVWVRGYPQAQPDGCVDYVAEWSDGTFTATPWDCAGGTVQHGELTASRGYPQLAANGCVEYVTRWSDGSYTWVPFTCPAGVIYPKPE